MSIGASLASAAVDLVGFNGWRNNLRLSNGSVELIVTLDVGPRIMAYRKPGGTNPLRVFEEQGGTTGEAVWRNRGGHRLWVAPEIREITYFPDNAAVRWEQRGPWEVRLTPPPEIGVGIQKQIDLALDPTGTGVTLTHRVTRRGPNSGELAVWALTVMAPGGVAIMPQPPLGEHPRDLLPNRKLVLWPYTDLSDPRWQLGRRFFRLRQDAAGGPTKLGLADAVGWCAYLLEDVCFVKRYAWDPRAAYPDGGCNFETFTNARMLEVESLGPLARLEPGQSLEHVERWELHDAPRGLARESEAALGDYFDALASR